MTWHCSEDKPNNNLHIHESTTHNHTLPRGRLPLNSAKLHSDNSKNSDNGERRTSAVQGFSGRDGLMRDNKWCWEQLLRCTMSESTGHDLTKASTVRRDLRNVGARTNRVTVGLQQVSRVDSRRLQVVAECRCWKCYSGNVLTPHATFWTQGQDILQYRPIRACGNLQTYRWMVVASKTFLRVRAKWSLCSG